MAVTRMLPNAVHFKEFYGGYHGTCGETALATALVCSSAQTESKQDAINLMLSMTKEMISLGWADKSGATTTRRLYSYAVRHGFRVDGGSFVGFSESLDMLKLHTLLLGLAGVKPIVLEVARAGELDSYNGGNDERGVNYHFICVVGITPDGYVCNDGDNSAIEQHLVVYPWSEIEQAKPCGILVVEMENTVAQLTLDNTHGYFAAEKDYWRCKKTGATIWGSILDFYRDNDGLARLRLPTHSAKQPFPDDDNADKKGIWAQPFEAGALVFDPKRLLDNPPNQTGPVYYAHIDSGVIVSLFSPTSAPVPTPAPLTDQEKADLALAAALRVWLASK